MTLHNVKGCVVALTTVAAALAFASCTKEAPSQDPAPGSDYTLEECVFQAVGDTAATKTVISDLSKGSVTWQAGDKVAIFSVDKYSGDRHEFTTKAGGDKATFEGEIESGTASFVAVYPYSSSVTYSQGGTFSNLTIPTSQTPTADSFAPGASLSYATGSRVPGGPCSDLTFSNLCAVISFTLPSNISFAKTITVSANNGANIAGTVSLSDGKLSGGSSKTVTLSGGFEAGHSYCVAILPGTYTGGFTFNIATNGNNSYTRSTRTDKNYEVNAGGLYPLGKLSVELTGKNFSTSVALSDKVSSSTLNGTDAKFTMSMNTSEFSSLFTLKSYSVTFKDANGNTYRTLSETTATMPSSKEMTAESNKPYIPKGNYSYEVTVEYNNGSTDKSLTFTSDFSREASPSGFALDATLSGHTSYDTRSNSEDGSTIYGIGASYKSGLSDKVYDQCSSLINISSTLDGSAKSGTQGSQSWASHTIGAKWSFDGASGTCASTKTVHVTGLPYYVSSFTSTGTTSSPKANDNNGKGWVAKSWHTTVTENSLRCGNPTGWATSGEAAWRSDFSFYLPNNIDITLSCPSTVLSSGSYIRTTFTAYVSGSFVFSDQSPSTSVFSPKPKKTVNLSGNGTLTTTTPHLFFESSYDAVGPWVLIHYVNITYR